MQISFPERQIAVRRAAAALCQQLGWAALHELPLPNGRRADLLALRPDGGFVCIEVKSGPRDFLTDGKWPDYRAFCDALYFAVDDDFPVALTHRFATVAASRLAALEDPAITSSLRAALRAE
jgi:hypothetical protein